MELLWLEKFSMLDDINNVDLKMLLIGLNTICASKMRSPFAVLEIEGNYIKSYIEKPMLDFSQK
jgi:hypothetical protein